MTHDPASFAREIPVLFAVTGIATAILVIGVRLLFRRGKSVTDL